MKKNIFIIFLVFMLMIVHSSVLLSKSESLWFGELSGPPTSEECKVGTVYYDTSLLKLRKCIDTIGPEWINITGDNVYKRFVTVGKSDKADFTVITYGADYIQKAIDSLKDSSEEKRSAIIIMPGIYDLQKETITCNEYVDLIGIDKDLCVISGIGKIIIYPADNSGIVNISIENKNKSSKSKAVVCENISSFSYISDCNITGNGIAVECINSLSFNIINCNTSSLNKYGIICKKSNPIIFQSNISGKSYALKCLASSKVTVFSSIVKGIYISKNSSVEMSSSDTAGESIDGKRGATLIMDKKVTNISIASEIEVKRSSIAKYANNNKENSPDDLKSSSENQVQIIETDVVYNRMFKKHNKNTILIDARAESAYSKKHIENAINIPGWKLRDHLKYLSKDQEIIVYCYNLKCAISEEVVLTLTFMGYSNVKDMKGGIEEWEERGYPVVTKRTKNQKNNKK